MSDIEHDSKKGSAVSVLEEVLSVGPGRAANPEEKQARLDAALEIDPGIQAWTIRALQVCRHDYRCQYPGLMVCSFT